MDQIKRLLVSPFSVDKYIGRPVEKCYIADLDSMVVGVMCMDRDFFTYSLDHIEVDPAVRRKGIGTSLIQNVRTAIPEDTSIEIDLDIRRHDVISFLKENNFDVVRRSADRIYLRNGWRFRSPPDVMFRITPEQK
jgi:ribosomal protein S18 acetylase RimI-like enzyme